MGPPLNSLLTLARVADRLAIEPRKCQLVVEKPWGNLDSPLAPAKPLVLVG